MSRKGVSIGEKRKRILEIYHTRKEPFNLKEIESLGAKAGVVSNAIKDVNQMLVDDSKVETDKIGGANYFWSFPSSASMALLKSLEDQKKCAMDFESKVTALENRVAQARVGKIASTSRSEKLESLQKLRASVASNQNLIEEGEQVAQIDSDIQTCKDAANRWTDNLFEIRTYLKKKKGLSPQDAKDVLKKFGVSPDLDYVDE